MRTRAPRRLPSLADVHPSPFSAVLGCRLQSWDADENLRARTPASPATRLTDRDRHWCRLPPPSSQDLRNNRSKCRAEFLKEFHNCRWLLSTIRVRDVRSGAWRFRRPLHESHLSVSAGVPDNLRVTVFAA